MKKFIIKIKYSWGDEEEPILINSNNKTDAFNYMIDLAIKETKTAIKEHNDEISIHIFPKDYDILLYYVYDGTQCYYELKEEE